MKKNGRHPKKMSESPTSFKTNQWYDDVIATGCTIHSVKQLNTINKRNGDPLFSLLDVEVSSPEGYRLPHIVFIRGHAVVVVPLLKNSDTGEERFLMVRQRRIGNGLLTLEFPAGMLDNKNDHPVDVAVRELSEETGLHISHNQLQPLINTPLYSSAGASDEAIFYFGCKVHLPDAEFSSFHQRSGGNSNENEHIIVELLERSEAEPQVSSLQARLGFFLFDQHFCNNIEHLNL